MVMLSGGLSNVHLTVLGQARRASDADLHVECVLL